MNENRIRFFVFLSISITLILIFSKPVFAQDVNQKIKELKRLMLRLEKRIAKLENLLLAPERSQKKLVIRSKNNWRNKANWKLLRKGMTKQEVEQILGEPPKINASINGDFWYYPDALGGIVRFYPQDFLQSWVEIKEKNEK